MTAVEWLEKEIFRKYKFTLQQLNCQPLEEAIKQAKEMEKKQQGYSEEEVLQLVSDWTDYRMSEDTKSKVTFKKWFEQFKKK